MKQDCAFSIKIFYFLGAWMYAKFRIFKVLIAVSIGQDLYSFSNKPCQRRRRVGVCNLLNSRDKHVAYPCHRRQAEEWHARGIYEVREAQ